MSFVVPRPTLFSIEMEKYVNDNSPPAALTELLESQWVTTAHATQSAPVFDDVIEQITSGNPALMRVLMWMHASDAMRESQFTR